ncbi:MAG: DUF554 domain-containing protein [Anaerolineales bacterium]|nr:DUF554 domain-containing protein [Anaerolineales bacterium]
MTGTILNVAAILVGGSFGLLFGSRIPSRFKDTITNGLGLLTLAIGLQMFFKSENQLIVLGSLLIGALLGEWWKIEEGLQALGQFLEKRFSRDAQQGAGSHFVRGFMTASLLFCVGPMTILGSIQDGLSGDYNLLAIKSVLDGFASMAFASTLGVGVLFSSLTVFAIQGGISLFAGVFDAILTAPMMNEMTAVGGVILVGLALSSLLEVKKIRTGSFLPALIIAPLIVWVMERWF